MAEVADLDDVPVADAAAEADEDEIWVTDDAEERLAVVAVCAPVTEDPVVADDADEAAAAVLEAPDDASHEATVGTAIPTLFDSETVLVYMISPPPPSPPIATPFPSSLFPSLFLDPFFFSTGGGWRKGIREEKLTVCTSC